MTLPALRQLRRALGGLLPELAGSDASAATLDMGGLPQEPPRTRACTLVEDDRLQARTPAGSPAAGFAAFLDGTQRSQAVGYDDGVPIVLGHVAAVVRCRVERRLVTWGDGPVAAERVYVPTARLSAAVRAALEASRLTIVDTAREREDGAAHPVELLRRAVDAVKRDREVLERRLAEAWCAAETRPLFADGGFPLAETTPSASACIGVVKSHHTLYVDDGALPVVLALPEGSRSSVFRVERTWGPPVLSWYLRLRRPSAHDPLRGLVRVEVSPDDPHAPGLPERADQISQWILAERNPLALPDARWDRMVYGVRDVEEYLRAVRGEG